MKSLLITILMLGEIAYGQQPAAMKHYCAGKKADGTACHMQVKNPGDYCHFHDPAVPRCAGVKKDGTRCKNIVNKAGEFCHYHKK